MVILCDLLDHPSALCGKSRRLFPRLKPSTKENGLKRNRIYGGAEMPSVHAHDYRLRFVCLNTVWVPKCGVTTSDSRRIVGGDATYFLNPPFPPFGWNTVGDACISWRSGSATIENSAVRGKRSSFGQVAAWCRWRPLWRDMSVLARVFELRVSERSDSRTANLVNVCANLLFIPVGDQGSIFRAGFSFVSVLNSTRSTIFGARPLVTQD